MPKFVYCSGCGMKLPITRKALPKYGRIIDLIDPHKCLEEPTELDLTPQKVPLATDSGEEEEGKFVQNLNNLSVRESTSTMDLQDRRKKDDVKSTAPQSLLQNIKSMENTTPAHGTEDDFEA